MSSSTALVPVIPKRSRSRVGNGNALFIEADGRSAWARRFADLVATYSRHIGNCPTPPQQALIRRIAAMDLEAERAEGRMAQGLPADMPDYVRQASAQRRLLAQLGFEGSARDDDVPTVEQIVAEYAARKS